MTRPRRRRASARSVGGALTMLASAVLVAACAIQPDNAPRDIPADERGQLDPVSPGAGEATGQSRIYLVVERGSGDQELRTVLRDVDPQTPEAVLTALIAGPNQSELDNGMSTSVPPTTTLHSAPRLVAGTLNVDLSNEILEVPGSALRLAVAQIVFTSSELDGVRSVRIRVDGQVRDLPDGRGELQTRPLSVYDYPGLAESAQPPYPPIPSDTPD